jgi:hypothetical protein
LADFTTVTIDYNASTGTDATPVWTGTTIAFGGSSGANEFRWQRTGGGGGAATGNAAWPNIIKPGANAFVEECWAFSADTTGSKCLGYPTAPGTQWARAFRFNFDANGSPASAMQFTAFQDTADTTPTQNSQTANATDGRNIINGNTTDCGTGVSGSSPSYFKANAFGSGKPSGGQETPTSASLSSTPAITNGTAGAVSPSAGAWIATNWQSMQGWISYIQAPALYVTAAGVGYWYFNCALWVGPNMATGNMVWVPFCIQYTWT